MNKRTPKQTRRGLQLFETNPYIENANANTNETTKRKTLRSRDGTTLMITNQTGEIVAPAGFWQTQEVDKTQFIKLYINGVKAFRELSAAGTKMFEVLYIEMQQTIGKDKVYLSYANLPKGYEISQATFTRGVRELMDKKFIAPCQATAWYWVNPDYMWNGDRLAYVKEYRLKRDTANDQTWREQLEAKGQLRLEDQN